MVVDLVRIEKGRKWDKRIEDGQNLATDDFRKFDCSVPVENAIKVIAHCTD